MQINDFLKKNLKLFSLKNFSTKKLQQIYLEQNFRNKIFKENFENRILKKK